MVVSAVEGQQDRSTHPVHPVPTMAPPPTSGHSDPSGVWGKGSGVHEVKEVDVVSSRPSVPSWTPVLPHLSRAVVPPHPSRAVVHLSPACLRCGPQRT